MLKSCFIPKSKRFPFLRTLKRGQKKIQLQGFLSYIFAFISTEKAETDYFLLMKRLDLWNGVRLSKQMIWPITCFIFRLRGQWHFLHVHGIELNGLHAIYVMMFVLILSVKHRAWQKTTSFLKNCESIWVATHYFVVYFYVEEDNLLRKCFYRIKKKNNC